MRSREYSTSSQVPRPHRGRGTGGRRHTVTELPCCSPSLTPPTPFPTDLGTTGSCAGCPDSSKHWHSLPWVCFLPHNAQETWGKEQAASPSAGNQGSERVSHMPKVTEQVSNSFHAPAPPHPTALGAFISVPPTPLVSPPPHPQAAWVHRGPTHEHMPGDLLPQPRSALQPPGGLCVRADMGGKQLHLHQAGPVPTPRHNAPGLSPPRFPRHLAHQSHSGRSINTMNQ